MDVERTLTALLAHVNTLSLVGLRALQRHVVPAIGNDTWFTGHLSSARCMTTYEAIQQAYEVEASTFIGAERQIPSSDFIKEGGVTKGFCVPLAMFFVMRPKLYPEMITGIGGFQPGRLMLLPQLIEQIVDNTTEQWTIYQSRLWGMDELDNVAMNLIAREH